MSLAQRRRVAFAIAGAVLAGLLTAGCGAGEGVSDPAAGGTNRYVTGDGTSSVFAPAERSKAPRVRGELLDGGQFDLAELRGKVVVLNFWASWCAPCRLEAPELQATYQATKDLGVQFVGVDIRDERDKGKAFHDSFGITYPSLFDPPGKTAIAFRDVPPNTIPATIVIDRKGRIAAVFRKAVLRDELEPVVSKIAAE